MCGINADLVDALARELGTTRPAVIRSGVGPQQTLFGESYIRQLFALSILGGHWDTPGGGFFMDAGPEFDEEYAANPGLSERAPRSLDMTMLGQNLLDANLYPAIKGLMVWNMNLAVVLPDAAQVQRGLAREDLFTVVLEHFVTDTALFADIVLPSTTQLEHFDILGAWGHHYISVNNPAIPPLGEAKSHGEVMRLLATRMGLEIDALKASDEEIAASALPAGVNLEELKRDGWKKSPTARWNPHSNNEKMVLAGELESPSANQSGELLQLLAPKSHHFLNSSFANMPRQRKAEIEPTLEMNPADAATRELSDGQRVVIKNTQGELETALSVTDKIRTGVVSLAGKWWTRPEHTNALGNLLTPARWSAGGQPAYNDTFVSVEGQSI